MKRRIAQLLSAIMLSTLIPFAAAAEIQADKRLEAVTQQVKQTLSLDTGAYTAFDGALAENTLAPVWHLNWSGADESLTVTAGEDGRIISFYRWHEDFSPAQGIALPRVSREAAQKTAQAFTNRVLRKGEESAALQQAENQSVLGRTSYRFSGSLMLSGVKSPLSVHVEVNAADNQVMRFSRDDRQSGYVGELPAQTPQADADKAAQKLKDQLSLRLEYVLDAEGKTAVLRYVPNAGPEYYVDAHSGALVDLTARLTNMRQMSKEELAGEGSTMDSGLTDAERSGAEKLAGVLSRDAIDGRLRKMPELGLAGYTLARAYFYTAEQTKKDEKPIVYADLTYGKQDKDGKVWNKHITADARTAALQSLWSSIPAGEKAARRVSEQAAQSKAAAFLHTYFADAPHYAHYAPGQPLMQDSDPNQWQHHYARQENGYPFPADSYMVGISAQDGTITRFAMTRPADGVKFASADGIVKTETALAAWQQSFDADLAYVAVPTELDLANPVYRPLIDAGQTWMYALKLGWQLDAAGLKLGIDAKTGAIVRAEAPKTEKVTYTDLDKHWAKALVLRLADYGIGYSGGTFAPDMPLRQKDMLALMLSMWGMRYDPEKLNAEQTDALYREAYQRGLLTRAERSAEQPITRADAVKLLLDGAGYGPAAALTGIYTCSYTDRASISSAWLGYAALAEGLGLVHSRGAAFNGSRTATRAEAAVMLHQLISR